MDSLTGSRTLRPGGTIEVVDMDLNYTSDDGTVHNNHPLCQFLDKLSSAMASRGVALKIAPEVPSQLEQAGFSNIRCEKPKLPLGWWPKDPRLKEIGIFHYAQFMDGLQGIAIGVFTKILKWDPNDVEDMIAKLKDSIRDQKIHGYWRK